MEPPRVTYFGGFRRTKNGQNHLEGAKASPTAPAQAQAPPPPKPAAPRKRESWQGVVSPSRLAAFSVKDPLKMRIALLDSD